MNNLERFQFQKGAFDPKWINVNLETVEAIFKAFPWQASPKTNTLWIPFTSGNRTAALRLDHEVEGFNDDGYLIGRNGNCSTPYVVIVVPIFWERNHVLKLAEMVANKLGKTYAFNDYIRSLKASRIEVIKEVISENPDVFLKPL